MFRSSYYSLSCEECDACLGRQYVSTPPQLESLRGMYSFSVDEVSSSYAVGQPQIAAREATEAERASQTSHRSPRASDSERTSQLETQMLKVERMLLLHHGKLSVFFLTNRPHV